MNRTLFDVVQSQPPIGAAIDDEQIERSARALYEFQQGCVNGTLSSLGVERTNCCPPWPNIHDQNKAWYRASARAALSPVIPGVKQPDSYAYVTGLSESGHAK
jgi:hypothetical protein